MRCSRRRSGGQQEISTPGTSRPDGDLRRRRRHGRGDRQAHDLLQPRRRRTRTGRCTRSSPAFPSTRSGSSSPDIGGGFGNKVGIYPGYVLAVVGSIVTGRPVKWVEDRSENLMSTSFARDYIMQGEIAATRDGKILALQVDVLADHGAFNATAQPTKYPAGFFSIFTGSYDLAGRPLHGQRRLHQQGARRGGVRVLVPDHRGGVPRRADGRLPGPRAGHGPCRAAHEEPAAS